MSKTVDERIVDMQFDNKQFESGVKQTRESIAKLNDDLQFRGATTGIEKVQESFNRFDFSHFAGAFDNLRVHLSGIEVFSKRIIENLTDSLYSGILKIKASITSVYNMISQGGSSRAQNIEQAKFQLEGLHVAWDDIKEDINYAVKDTAYGLDSAAKAASQLVASNVQLGEEMKYSLRGISGLAAMTNSTYEDISRIFTKVAGQGRLMGDDLNSIAARGINVAAELAKVFDTTEAEIRDMVSKGKIDFKTFAKAMDDAFGQHAKDANKTYAGSLSNVKAALSRLGADIATTKFETLRDIFNELIPKIDEFKKEFKPAEEAIQNLIKTIGKLIQTLIKNTDVPKFAKKISDIIVKIADKISYLIDQFSRAIKVVKRIEQMNSFKKIQNGAEKAASAIDSFGSELEKILSFSNVEIIDNTREYNKELQAAKDIVEGVYGELNGQERINYIKDVLGLDPAIVQDYINQVYDAGKSWDEVSLKAGDNADTLNDKYVKLSDTIKNIVKTFNAVKHVIKNVITSIKNVAKVLFDSFKETFSVDLSNSFGDLPNTLINVSDKLVITEEKAAKLKPIFDTVFTTIKYVIDGLKKLADKVKEFIEWLKNNETVQKIASSIKNLFTAIINSFTAFKKHLENSETFKRITETLKPIISELGNFIGYIISGITSVIERAITAVQQLQQGRGLFDTLSEFLIGTEEKRTTFYNVIKGGFIVGFIWAIAKALYKLRLFANDGIFYLFRFLSVLSNLSRVLVTYKYYLRTSAFLNVAKGIGYVVLALVGLSYYINKNGAESVMQSVIIIAGMITGILTIMHWIGKVEGVSLGFSGLIRAAVIIRSMGLAILSIAGSIYFISSTIDKYGIGTAAESFGIIIGAMMAMVGVVIILTKMTTTLNSTIVGSGFTSVVTATPMQKAARVILAMSIAMLLISKAISSLVNTVSDNKIESTDLWVNGILPIVSLMGIMTAAIIVLTKMTKLEVGFSSLNRVARVMLAMSIAIMIVSKALASLIDTALNNETSDIWHKAVGPLLAIFAVMIIALVAISKMTTTYTQTSRSLFRMNGTKTASFQRIAGVLLAMSIAVLLISKAISSLLKTVTENNINATDLWKKGILPIIAILGTISVGLTLISALASNKSSMWTPGKLASLAIVVLGIGGAMLLISFAMTQLLNAVTKNNMSNSDLWLRMVLPIIAVLAVIFGALVGLSILVKPHQLLLISGALFLLVATLTAALIAFGVISTLFDETELLKVTGVVAIIVLLATLLGTVGLGVAPGIAAASAALLIFGAALIVVSAGAIVAGVALKVLVSAIVDTIVAIVKGLSSIVEEIPKFVDAICDAIAHLAYSVGKALISTILLFFKGLIDGIKETLGINSPSTVFESIGGYCIEGLWIGLLEGLEKIGKKVQDMFKKYIADPFCDFFGINSPSEWFSEKGEFMIDGLEEGLNNGLKDLDLSSFEGLGDDISSKLPDMGSLGSGLGLDFSEGLNNLNLDNLDLGSIDIDGFNLDQVNMDGLATSIKETAAEQIRGIDLTEYYSLDDLIEDESLYYLLKESGETQLTAAYEEWKRHSEFLTKYPTYQAWLDDIENNYSEAVVRKYREGNEEIRSRLESDFAKGYIDQSVLDGSTFKFMRSYKESLERAADQELTDQTFGNITAGIVRKMQANRKQEYANYEIPAFVTMTVQDDTGTTIEGIQKFIGTDGTINLDYDTSSVKTNMDAISSDVVNAINDQTTKMVNGFDTLKATVSTLDNNQNTRIGNINSRMDKLESAIRSMQLRLDTGALVGQLVVPLDSALGERASRKSRG